VYKGIEFQAHAHLYYLPQKIAEDPKLCSNTRINNIKKQLEEFEDKIISRTKQSISPEEQNMGKLIQCLPSDAILTTLRHASLILFKTYAKKQI
jgi:hypothetical protein